MYVPYTWQTGEVITAEKLNKLEQGVKGAYEVLVVTGTATLDGEGNVTYSKASMTAIEIEAALGNGYKTAVLVLTKDKRREYTCLAHVDIVEGEVVAVNFGESLDVSTDGTITEAGIG